MLRGLSRNYKRDNLELATFIKTNVIEFEDDAIENLIDFFIDLGVHPLTLGRYSDGMPSRFCCEWYNIRECLPEHSSDEIIEYVDAEVDRAQFYGDFFYDSIVDAMKEITRSRKGITKFFVRIVREYGLQDEIFFCDGETSKDVSRYLPMRELDAFEPNDVVSIIEVACYQWCARSGLLQERKLGREMSEMSFHVVEEDDDHLVFRITGEEYEFLTDKNEEWSDEIVDDDGEEDGNEEDE